MESKCIFIVGLILTILMAGTVSATDTVSENFISDADDAPLEITGNDV